MEDGSFGVARQKPIIWYPHSLCEICTAPASGVHYGVVACEGCKAFYRRSITQNTNYQCYFGWKCTVRPQAKGRCRACRYQRCVKSGMKLDTTKMGRVPLRRREVSKALSSLNVPKKPAVHVTDPERPTASPSTSHFEPVSCKTSPPSAVKDHVDAILSKVRLSKLVCKPHTATDQPNVRGSMDEAQSLRRSSVISFVPKSSQAPLERFRPQTDPHSCLDVNHSGFETPHWLAEDGWRDVRKESTIKIVTDLISDVHGEDFATWDAFMHDCLVDGNVPNQPQVSLRSFIDNIFDGISTVVNKHCKLSLGLPGYSAFSKADQQTLVSNNWMAAWLTTHHRYYRYETAYYLIGPLQIHYGIYWLQQMLEPDYLRAVFACTAALNKLELSRVEAFLLLTIAMFTPGSTDVANEAHMFFLHSHYTDCLLSLLRANRRGGIDEIAKFEEQLLGALKMIRRFNLLTRGYVRTLDLTEAPFRPKEGSVLISIPDIMDGYCDSS